ncbi:MAG: TetR family transcriptional regulator [Actinobacteria bacterium]|nr:TetR family transcriptional regulator [Actinomycetota bacterium]
MARIAKADYMSIMVEAARRRLEAGDEVTIGAIATELGVSPGLVHFYFGSRQALIDAAWRSIMMAFVANDQDDVTTFAETNDWDGVTELVHRIFANERDAVHLTHVRAAVEAMRAPELRRLLLEATDVTVASWKELIERYTALGVVSSPLDAEALAMLFMAVPMGVAVVAPELTDHQREIVAEAWAMMIRAVLDPTFVVPGRPSV